MESVSISASIASDIIRGLGERIGRSINIMDRGGVIISSTVEDRIGTFHEAAYRLITTGSNAEAVSRGEAVSPLVQPGVNLPITYRGDIIGVVGIEGDPKQVESIAHAVKTTVETMVEYELYKEHTIRRQDKKNLFLNYLLYEDEAPRAVVEGLALKLGYDPSVHRAAILMRLKEGIDANEAIAVLRRNNNDTHQDISFVTPDGSILVFKRIGFKGGGILSQYQEQTERYVKTVAAALRSCGNQNLAQVCVGSYQKNFKYYRAAYRQILWLAEYVSDRSPSPVPVFFYDHVVEYIASRVPRSELCQIFGATVDLLQPDVLAVLRDSLEALIASAFNGKEAAARLGIHRNTLTMRIQRIGELFGVDLRWNAHARDFLSMMARYLRLPGASPERN
jgi:carbohydrate diacid regulator